MRTISRLLRTFTSLRRRDEGLGVVTVVMVMAVVSALVVTAVALTINNLGNASRDRQALAAMATSEAGVAQALQFLRGGNLSNLTCTEPAPGGDPGADCQGPGPSWISVTSPMQIRTDGVAGGCIASVDCVEVWIGTLSPYVPNCPGRHAADPEPCSGSYRVHTTGISGNGPGQKALAVDVQVTPYPFPIGVFAESFSGNGNVGIHRMSLFTNGCMSDRQRDDQNGSGLQFEYDTAAGRPVLDLIYDQPAAAHAAGEISTANGSCGTQGQAGPIHEDAVCNPLYRFDQSGSGGPLTANDGCHGEYVRSDGSVYPETSEFGPEELERYGYRPRGLTDAQYDALRSQADAQGTLNIDETQVAGRLNALNDLGITSPVLFWDNGDVDLDSADFPADFLRPLSDDAGCTSNSVTIVVEGPGHDLSYSGGNTAPYLVASIFVPDGELTGQGGVNTIGTVFAQTIDLGGNVEFYMDSCFANNPPGAVLDVEITNFREDDSQDIT
jgi:hypothetical protein